MKTNTFFNIIAAAALLSCGSASAGEFYLSGAGAGDIPVSYSDKKVSPPQQDLDALISLDLTVRVPYKFVKNAVVKMAASEKRLTILDAAAPLVGKVGDFMVINNISVDAGGIIVVPTLTLKPYFEGVDRLAIRVQKIQLHASMAPDAENPSDFQPLPAGGVKKADGGGLPENINQEEIMVKVMDVLIQGVYNSLNVKLKAKNIPMKAEQIIALSYNKTDWTLRAKLSTKVMQYLIPAGIIGDFHLTAFQFTSKGWTVGIQTAQ